MLAKDSELEAPLRGKVTAKGKVTSPIGMNTTKSCGKTEYPSGRTKHSGISCSEFSKRYDEAFDALEEIAEQLGTLQEGPECDACLQNFIARLKQANLKVKDALDPKVQEIVKDTYGGEKISKGDRKTASGRNGAIRRKMKKMAGMEFPKSGFHSDETKLLRTSSLYK